MIIEKAKFPDYRYEFIYTISQNQGDYFLSFDFLAQLLNFLTRNWLKFTE